MRSAAISVHIDAAPARVHAYASHPGNLPAWARTFCQSIESTGDGWLVHTPDGPVYFAFAENAPVGVLDHTLTFPSGMSLTNQMRVVPDAGGSLVSFTLLQREGMSDQAFETDVALVRADLDRLREILEREDG